jgi:hypothetical protein
MVPRIREQITKWTAQGPSAAGIPKAHGPLEKIDVIPGILAVPTLDEDGDKIQFAKKILFKVLRSLPLTDDAAAWPSRDAASAVIGTQFARILPRPAVQWTDVTSDRAMALLAFQDWPLIPCNIRNEAKDLSYLEAQKRSHPYRASGLVQRPIAGAAPNKIVALKRPFAARGATSSNGAR